MSQTKKKIANFTALPLAAVCVYLLGLFLLVMDKYVLGIILVIAALGGGVYAGIEAMRSAYKPSRSQDPRWMKLLNSLIKSLSREKSRNSKG